MRDRILVVDDEESVTLLLKNYLESQGYTVNTASNGLEAVNKLKTDDYSLVISDVKMPQMDGIELLKAIKGVNRDIVVVMVTAIVDLKTAVQALKLGASDYIIKPFDLEEVNISVSRGLEKRRLILENMEYQENLEKKVEEQAAKIRNLFIDSLKSLAQALEAKDSYTESHSEDIASYTAMVAEDIGLPSQMVDKIRLAGLLHDIGKIGVKESILNKPGKLTEEEYLHVMRHPVIGENILKPIIKDEDVIDMVRHHHERYDGKGLPDGLKGKEISIGARIMAVADTYHAMTSTRPYRKALPHETAVKEIIRCSGSQFDPDIAKAFLKTAERLAKQRKG